MNVFLRAAVVGAVCAVGLPVFAAENDNFERSSRVLGLGLGSSSAEGNFNFNGGAVSADMGESFLPSLAYGIQHKQARFMLEYYYSDFDAAPDDGSAEVPVSNHSLFYSGYWIPKIPYVNNLRGILGAGIGYTYQTIDWTRESKFEDGAASFKASVGVEYYVLPKLSVYGMYDYVTTADMEDDRAPTSGGNEVPLKWSDFEQNQFTLGVHYYF